MSRSSRRCGSGSGLNTWGGSERLKGKSIDFPKFSGPNGILAEELGTAGSFSPATRPEIF